jgi:hypothetical protein
MTVQADIKTMPRFPRDLDVEDALLEGRVVVDDAPPGLQHIARLMGAARAPASDEDQAAGDRLLPRGNASGTRQGLIEVNVALPRRI